MCRLRTKGQHRREGGGGDPKASSGNVLTGVLGCSFLLSLTGHERLQTNTAVPSWEDLCLRIWWEFVFSRLFPWSVAFCVVLSFI